MAPPKHYYLTLDTETATLPFVNEMELTASQKKNIAIAKPLVYDIGWTITDRNGNIFKKENFLVQETFFVPNVFNTAYYKDKRPIYMQLLKEGKIQKAEWNTIIEKLLYDLHNCHLSVAYNACFDFKKSIPFTERYIEALYSENYNEWEAKQKKACIAIANKTNIAENPDYLTPIFELRGEQFPIADLWTIACNRLINIDKYRSYCIENNLLTNSTQYFKTSAETAFQYLARQYDFVESHTALDDSEIEAFILTKALKKGKIDGELSAFPFRELGTTTDFVIEKKPKYAEALAEMVKNYIDNNDGWGKNGYWKRMENELGRLLFLINGGE